MIFLRKSVWPKKGDFKLRAEDYSSSFEGIIRKKRKSMTNPTGHVHAIYKQIKPTYSLNPDVSRRTESWHLSTYNRLMV